MGKDTIKFIRRQSFSPFYKVSNKNISEKPQTCISRSNSMEGMEDVDERISSKISQIARKQKERLQKANEDEEERNLNQRFPLGFDPDEDIDRVAHVINFEELGIDPSDDLYDMFLSNTPGEQNSSTDITMGDEKDNIIDNKESIEDEYELSPRTGPKVTEMYKRIGEKLNCFTSGKLPKSIKIIPSLSNWEEVLHLTEPDLWSPQAVYKITCMFVVSLNNNQAQLFFSKVVLKRVRKNVIVNKSLNHHLYLALKKTLKKPISFIKGILLPLCESGTCTLIEAATVGSILMKSTLSTLHSSTALSRLTEMNYTGSNSLFIRLLLERKYALSFKIVNALVIHFVRFKNEPRKMPTLWYQSLLTFVQRYKQDLISEQKQELLEIMDFKHHSTISPKIIQELISIKMQNNNDVSMTE